MRDVLLLDVIPLSLGIETLGGVATKLIEKNTTIPTARSQVFSTAADSQTSVEIHIVQGERPMVSDNKSLGRFILDGLPPAPRGIPQVEVTFDIDANGILAVKAKDKATAKEQSIRIEARSGLSKEEIERMTKEADAHKDEDAKKRELVEVRNLAEQLIYTAERTLKDNKDKVSADSAKAVEEGLSALKKANEGSDIGAIKAATEALSQEMQKVGQALYQKSQPGTPNTEPPKDEKGPEGPIRDAETK